MLYLSLQVKKFKTDDDRKRYNRIIKKWTEVFVAPKKREILKNRTGERICIENGLKHFAVYSWKI